MTTHRRATSDEQLESRVQGEFLEMPGLRLSFDQAQRLWGLDPDTCSRILQKLIDRGFLSRDGDGRYARPSDRWPSLSFRPAKADIQRSPKQKRR